MTDINNLLSMQAEKLRFENLTALRDALRHLPVRARRREGLRCGARTGRAADQAPPGSRHGLDLLDELFQSHSRFTRQSQVTVVAHYGGKADDSDQTGPDRSP